MMKCERCGGEIAPDEVYEHHGQRLCEDCYMDALSPTKACDPWAVYTAQRNMEGGAQLSPLQEKIVELLEKEGPLSPSKIQARLGIGEKELQREFATLRHMGRVRGMKKDGGVLITLF